MGLQATRVVPSNDAAVAAASNRSNASETGLGSTGAVTSVDGDAASQVEGMFHFGSIGETGDTDASCDHIWRFLESRGRFIECRHRRDRPVSFLSSRLPAINFRRASPTMISGSEVVHSHRSSAQSSTFSKNVPHAPRIAADESDERGAADKPGRRDGERRRLHRHWRSERPRVACHRERVALPKAEKSLFETHRAAEPVRHAWLVETTTTRLAWEPCPGSQKRGHRRHWPSRRRKMRQPVSSSRMLRSCRARNPARLRDSPHPIPRHSTRRAPRRGCEHDGTSSRRRCGRRTHKVRAKVSSRLRACNRRRSNPPPPARAPRATRRHDAGGRPAPAVPCCVCNRSAHFSRRLGRLVTVG